MTWRGVTAAFALACSSAALSADIAITANVNGESANIGNIALVSGTLLGKSGVQGKFTFNGAWNLLDDWYDFQWINVEVGYTVDGSSQGSDPVVGPLPAIDPQSHAALPSGMQDGLPYYYSDAEWAANTAN